MQNINLKFSAPITESATIDNAFVINGVAINETTTSNGHRFIAEELRSAAKGMIGIPLLKDHNNSVDAIMGRVIDARFNESQSNIPFKARVSDENAKKLIQRGDLNSVSIGATARELEEAEDGSLIARGLQIKELSLVAVPADSGATFAMAMKEAWNNLKSQSCNDIIELNGGDESMSDKKILEAEVTEAKEIVEDKESATLKKQLAEAESKLAEFAAKERKDLESKYTALCASKKVTALDISEKESSVLKFLIEQLESIAEVKEEVVKADVKEVSEESEVAEKDFAVVEGAGSLRGGSLTLVRHKYK